jgi:methyltransferase (TIGR00027 family)
MKKNKSGQTAFGVAIARYVEQYQPNETRLFDDEIVKYLLPGWFLVFLKIKFIRNWVIKTADKMTKGIYDGLICRTEYIDKATHLISENNIQQVLILGSGLDTRPYRLKELKKVKVFEVDLAWVQDFKKQKIKKHFGSLPDNIKYVAIDFNNQTLKEVMQQHNFNFSEPTFIIWEGVTQYITKDAVEKTLDFISKTPKGSYLVFTYVQESVIKRESMIEGANEFVDSLVRKKTPWIFGMEKDNVESFIKNYNLKLLSDIRASDIQKDYLNKAGRQVQISEIERIVTARVD